MGIGTISLFCEGWNDNRTGNAGCVLGAQRWYGS